MNLVITLIFGLSVLAAAVAGVTMAAHLVVNKPMVGAALCLAPATWIWGGRWDLPVTDFAGLTVYASDVVAVVLIVAAFIQLDKFGDWAWPLAGITVLLSLSLLQGMAFFGVAAAFNGARSSIYLIAAVWWAVTVNWSKQDIGKGALVAGWFLVALALLHLSLYGFATVDSTAEEDSVSASYRMLNATQALILALCTATVLFDQKRRRPASAAVFTMVIIAAQNRSVWIGFISGFLAVALLSADSGRRRQAFGPVALATLVAALVLAGMLGGSIGSKLATAGTDTGSWNWRIQSWQGLLDQWLSGPFTEIILGQPFGQDFTRLVNGSLITVAAHSWYVELPLNFGVMGLALWLILIVRGMARARKGNAAALFFGAAFLCHSVAYSLPWNVAPWLGILLIVQASARRSGSGGNNSTGPAGAPSLGDSAQAVAVRG